MRSTDQPAIFGIEALRFATLKFATETLKFIWAGTYSILHKVCVPWPILPPFALFL
jgi:hypothetical protein